MNHGNGVDDENSLDKTYPLGEVGWNERLKQKKERSAKTKRDGLYLVDRAITIKVDKTARSFDFTAWQILEANFTFV